MDYPKSVPGVGLVGGKFVDENPGTGQQGSLIPSKWGNSVTDELIALLTAAGVAPSEADSTQVLGSICKLFESKIIVVNASGPFGVPDVLKKGYRRPIVLVTAGGGSGGRGDSGNKQSGGGGGAGGTAVGVFDLTGVNSVDVVIGAGGSPISATSVPGGASSFGAYLSATGGGGATGVTGSIGGPGGNGVGGLLRIPGGYGGDGTILTLERGSGNGGASFWGGGGRSSSATETQPAAYGSGGGGSSVGTEWGNRGLSGVLVIAY